MLGVDVASSMIDLVEPRRRRRASERCEFRHLNFIDFDGEEQFDVVVATGYFDYLDDPVTHLQKMLAHCRGRIFASIPKRWEFRVPMRKTRFALARGYVRFYSEARRSISAAGKGGATRRPRFHDQSRPRPDPGDTP